MIKIMDTHSQIDTLFVNGTFDLEKWESYMNSLYKNSADIFKNDLKEYLNSGEYVYEKDILPILNAVYQHPKL